MRTLRAVVRSGMVLALLLAAVADGQVRKLLGVMRPGPNGAVWAHRWCRRIVRALGIEFRVDGTIPDAGAGMLAVVSNHMTYLDVLLYSSIRPFVMVSKRQVRSWPLVGWITAQAGTIYLARGEDKVAQTRDEVNAKMAEGFRSGLPVLFFPEGTTGDGSGLLPFRRGLFHAVLRDQVPMRVAAMRWELTEDNGGATLANDVCFVGDANFAPHLINFLGLSGVKVKVRFGDEAVRGDDAAELGDNARAMMVEMWEGLHETQAAEPVSAGADYRGYGDRVSG